MAGLGSRKKSPRLTVYNWLVGGEEDGRSATQNKREENW